LSFGRKVGLGRGQVLGRLATTTADNADDRASGTLAALDVEAAAALLVVREEGR
jgi:hypothetical protein